MYLTQENLDFIKRVNTGDFVICRIVAGRVRLVCHAPNVPAYCGLSGEEYVRLFGEDILKSVTEGDRSLVMKALERTLDSGADQELMFRLCHSSRGFIWTRARLRRLCGEGREDPVIAEFQNASDEADTFANLLNESQRIIYVVDAATFELYYANRAALDYWHRDKLEGGTCFLQMRGQKEPCPWCVLRRMTSCRLHEEAHYDPGLNAYLQIDAQYVRWFGRDGVAIFVNDVTERHMNTISIENANSEMTRIISSIPAGICVFRIIKGVVTCIDVNPYCCRVVGRSKKELVGETFKDIEDRTHPDDVAAMSRTIMSALAEDRSAAGTYRFMNPMTKHYSWIHLEARLVAQPSGEDYCYMNLTDVTELKEAQARADDNRRIYQLAAQSGGLRVWEYDLRTREASFISSKTTASTGMPSKLAGVPQSMLKYLDEESVPGFLAMYEQVEAGHSASCDIWHHTDSSSELLCDRLNCEIVRDANGCPVKAYGIARDVTAEKMELKKYSRTLRELLAVNPLALCTFRLNLTRNTCSEGLGTSRYVQEMLQADTVDGLCDNIAGVISVPSDEKKFRGVFNRKALLDKFRQGETRLEIKYRRLVDSGGSHWVSTCANMLQNPNNGDIEAIVYSFDIDRETKEGQVIDSITRREYDYVALVDTETRDISFFNVSDKHSDASPVQKPSYDESVHATLAAFAEPADSGRCDAELALETVLEKLSHDDYYAFSYLLHDLNGRKCRKQVSFRYLDETKKQILLTRSDVTAAFLQEQLQAARIQDALESAERANKLKSDFLSNVSHDMRTPLNAVLGYAELARNSDDLSVNRDFLGKIQKAGTTLLALINDTLDLQKIETGATKIKLAPVPCSEVLKGIVTAVKPMMDAKHINFVLDNSRASMATINADSMRIQEIMINLLSNAAKFTPERGRIDLVIECLRLEKDRLYDKITVRDNGCGISAGFLPKIFEPFSQERTAATAGIGGSGLGLSIVKRLLNMMGARIEVKSELGKGSEFCVYFDFERLDEISAAGEEKAAATRPGIAGMKLLLCEDNEMNTEIAKTLLEMHGASVVCAPDGKQGLGIFAASAPGDFDAILMDIRMPVMDGYAATAAIRALKRPDAASIPIIAMSADAFEDDVKKSLEAGMTAHVAKPIDPDKLFAELARTAV